MVERDAIDGDATPEDPRAENNDGAIGLEEWLVGGGGRQRQVAQLDRPREQVVGQAGGTERDAEFPLRIAPRVIEHATADRRQVKHRKGKQDQAGQEAGHASKSSGECRHRYPGTQRLPSSLRGCH